MSSESVSEAFAAIFMRWCMAAHICDCHNQNYRVLYEGWFVRTFEQKVAMVAFVVVVVLCINRFLMQD